MQHKIRYIIHISRYIITKAAKWHGLEDTICRWIDSMLGSRKITAMLAGENLEGSVARGCLPLLWTNS